MNIFAKTQNKWLKNHCCDDNDVENGFKYHCPNCCDAKWLF